MPWAGARARRIGLPGAPRTRNAPGPENRARIPRISVQRTERISVLGSNGLSTLGNQLDMGSDTLRNRTGKKGLGTVWGAILLLSVPSARAQNAEIPLWPNGAPRATGTAPTDIPSITPYPAANPSGAAVIVFPGGGYSELSTSYEGTAPAQWLAGKGISAFVVKYRLGSDNYHHPIEMWDAQRAVRWVRANAAKYRIDTARVGVLGFSAGGHLAATVSTHYDGGNPGAADTVDRHPCRPAFSILAYPVITMDSSFTHGGSRYFLLGNNPGQALVDSLSNEKQVNGETPPAFLFHAQDDGVVPIRNSQSYYDSCLKKGVTASFMKFDHGGHGFGMADYDPVLHAWCDSSLKWLDQLGFFKPRTTALAAPGHRSAAHPARGGDARLGPARRGRDPLLRLPAGASGSADALGRRPRPSSAETPPSIAVPDRSP
jgi:acetyl esterase/lipase